MKTFNFKSSLANKIKKFIALRQLSGTDYHSQAKLLYYFDKFLVKSKFKDHYLTKNIIHCYMDSIGHLCTRGQANRFSVVKQLCRYLSQFNSRCYIPDNIRKVHLSSTRPPYIFTKKQIQNILAMAAKLTPQNSLRPHTFHTLFGLLYTTGLRISEAFSLNIQDVNLNSKLLHIRKGKFRKERWVALSPSTATVLKLYMERCLQIQSISPDRPLFISLRRNRLTHSTVYNAFIPILKQSGISKKKQSGPRIHDFRHSFAVHRLLEWYRDGKDINARLPALATYMGHVNIASTQIYIQAIPELLQETHQRSLNYFRQHIIKTGGQHEA